MSKPRHDLTRLLHPRSIAVFGGAAAAAVLGQCDRMGYDGDVWPVHPVKDAIAGRKAYRSVDDLPGTPDAAFIGVNRVLTIDIARDLARIGAGGAVSYASGFREVGPEGDALQAALVAAAGAMPVVGPNCYGFINACDGALLWPDVHGLKPVKRGVAIVAQSSNIAINLTMNRRGLPIAFVLALGNQAMVGLADAVATLAEDDRVSAIGLHIEGITDAAAFAEAVAKARAAGKPVVALKAGRSEIGSQIAMTHTASLAGSHKVASAYLERIGVCEVRALPALLEALKLLHQGGGLGSVPFGSLRSERKGPAQVLESGAIPCRSDEPIRSGNAPAGGRIVSLSCSGGEASLMSDAVEGRRLVYPAFSPADAANIRATVDPLVTVSNPFDYHTFDWGNRARLADTFAAVMASRPDLTILVLDWPKAELGTAPTWDIAADALIDARARVGGRAAVLSTLSECMPEDWAERLLAAGIVPLQGIAEAMEAIEAVGSDPESVGPVAATSPLIEGSAVTLGEADAKQALAAAGLRVPAGGLARSRVEARAIAARVGFPLVAKASRPDLLHKTEHGGVVVGIGDPSALDDAFDRLSAIGDAVLVEAMVTDAVCELILGVARDPAVGLHLMIGAGGILAELIEDTAILCLPVDRAAARRALSGLRVFALLKGHRGKPAGDIEAVVDAIMTVAALTEADAARLLEIDVNPLMVRPAGRGAIAVDALIRRVEA